jgi:hypothetical protein
MQIHTSYIHTYSAVDPSSALQVLGSIRRVRAVSNGYSALSFGEECGLLSFPKVRWRRERAMSFGFFPIDDEW